MDNNNNNNNNPLKYLLFKLLFTKTNITQLDLLNSCSTYHSGSH